MGETWQVDGPKVIEVGSERRAGTPGCSVGLVAGRVDVVAHDDAERARARGHPGQAAARSRSSWKDGELSVSHPQAKWDGLLATGLKSAAVRRDDAAELSIAVPRGVRGADLDGLGRGLWSRRCTADVEVRTRLAAS